jgi:hypothetical protein
MKKVVALCNQNRKKKFPRFISSSMATLVRFFVFRSAPNFLARRIIFLDPIFMPFQTEHHGLAYRRTCLLPVGPKSDERGRVTPIGRATKTFAVRPLSLGSPVGPAEG